MKVAEAAARLEVSSATIYGLVAAGKLRCHRVGLGRGAIRISEQHIAEFLAGAEPVVKPAPAPVAARTKVRLKHLHR
jgi:excisionase family DNA binding protein